MKSLGFDNIDDFREIKAYYEGVIKTYMTAKELSGADHIGWLLSVALGGYKHDYTFRATRDLIVDLMMILSDPDVSGRLEAHLQRNAGGLLKGLLFLFDSFNEDEIGSALDLLALTNDFTKDFTISLDDKYSELYKEAGLKMPDIPTGSKAEQRERLAKAS